METTQTPETPKKGMSPGSILIILVITVALIFGGKSYLKSISSSDVKKDTTLTAKVDSSDKRADSIKAVSVLKSDSVKKDSVK